MNGSTIQWLHLTDQDMSRATRVIDAFKEDDTVDVLGFQPISEHFDDWFYPAVTTPMTRARYYLFVPAIYSHLERRGLGFHGFREQAAVLQHRLQQVLSDKEPKGRGVIGEDAEKKIKRLPSALYWSALGKLGIRLPTDDGRDLHEVDYQLAATSAPDADRVETDEGTDANESARRFWDLDLPTGRIVQSRRGLRNALSLTMSAGEAKYLRDKFLDMPAGKESLLGFRLRRGLDGPYEHAWSMLDSESLPSSLTMKLKHARSFSAAARALSVIYFALVTEKQRDKKVGGGDYTETLERLEEELSFWWNHGRGYVGRGWNVEDFRTLGTPPICSESDLKCFKQLVGLIQSYGNPRDLFRDRRLRALVKEREGQKRRGKCRLCDKPEHIKYLRQWGGPPNRWERAFQLSFRHHRADTIVRDLLRKPYRRRSDVQD